jgi:ArsR family transcriptional regulator, lead/cadmium/zinc/bismuth-responsive transcriptional repressor
MDTISLPPTLDEHTAAHVAEIFRAFSDTSRIRILFVIVEKEVNISTLAKMVGITESAVSHHMRGLRQMRIVQARRDGKEVYYSVDDPHIIALFQQGVRHVQEKETSVTADSGLPRAWVVSHVSPIFGH